MILYSMILTTAIIFIFRFLNAERKPQILGVYQQENKGYYLKFAFMFLVLSLRKLYKYVKRRLAIELGKSDDGTMHVHTEEHELEQVQYLGDYPQAVDSVYFNGTSKSGAALVCSVSRRKNRVCDAFLFVKVEDGELLLSPKLPDSYLEQKDTEEGEYSVEGIQVKNLVPMRSWTVQYRGEMKSKTNPQKTVQVEVNLTWSTAFQPFNYDNLSPLSLAKDMARETWNASYFKMLKRYHETHYEQMGDIDGTVTIDGKEHILNMRCVRDHCFGKHREWGNMHRYVYHFIYLENGDCIAVGSASLPLTMSHLTLGYLCRKSAQRVLPVSACNFQLYQHGEQQILPKDYGFSFEAGSKTYAVQVLVQDEETFFVGKEREAKFYERWCKYQVNGVQGWGCVEWHYNNAQANKRK